MILSKVQLMICIVVLAVLLCVSVFYNARMLHSTASAVDRIETMHEKRLQRLEEMAH